MPTPSETFSLPWIISSENPIAKAWESGNADAIWQALSSELVDKQQKLAAGSLSTEVTGQFLLAVREIRDFLYRGGHAEPSFMSEAVESLTRALLAIYIDRAHTQMQAVSKAISESGLPIVDRNLFREQLKAVKMD